MELGVDSEIVDAADVVSYGEACRWLKEAAVRNYPASAFGRKYGGSAKVVTLAAPRQRPLWSS